MIIFLNHCGEAANLLSSYLQQLSDLPGIAHRQLMGAYILAFHVIFYGKICAYLCADRLLSKPIL